MASCRPGARRSTAGRCVRRGPQTGVWKPLCPTSGCVEAYEACFGFYTETLGTTATFGDETSGYADLETGDVTLALFDREEMLGAVGDAPTVAGGDRAASVFRVEDVDATAETLAAAAVPIAAGPTDRPGWGIRTVHGRDPDGTLIEWNEPLG